MICIGWWQGQHRLEAGGSGLCSSTRLERYDSAGLFPSMNSDAVGRGLAPAPRVPTRSAANDDLSGICRVTHGGTAQPSLLSRSADKALAWYRSKQARKMKAPRGSNAEAPQTRIVAAVAPDAKGAEAAEGHRAP